MTLLRSCAKELDRKFVLAFLLSTYCDDQRIDVMVYSLDDCQMHIWHGTDLLNHFWCDLNSSYEDHAVVLAALQLFLTQKSLIYDTKKALTIDTHVLPERREHGSATEEQKVQALTYWKKYQGSACIK